MSSGTAVPSGSRSDTGRRGARAGTAEAVQAFVVGGSPGAVPVEVLIDNGLAGYAVARAAALGEPVASRLRQAWVSLSARHLVTRRAIGELLAAWAAAGIETLVFKGFAWAEFVYAEPSWRAISCE